MSLAFGRRKLALRQRLEEAVGHLKLAPVGTEAAFDRLGRNSDQPRNGSLATDDHDLLPGRGALDEAREMRLGRMNGYGSHTPQVG